MALSWIRVDRDIAKDPKIRSLALRISQCEAATVGFVVLVFIEMAAAAKDGDISHFSDLELEIWARWPGKRGKFAAAFREIFAPQGSITSWAKHNGDNIKIAEMEAERKRLERLKRKGDQLDGERAAAAAAPAGEPPRRQSGKVRTNGRTDDASSSASSAGARVDNSELLTDRLFREIPASDHGFVRTLLSRVDFNAPWIAELEAALDGMHAKRKISGDRLGLTCREFIANGEPMKIRLFQGYLRRAAEDSHEPKGNARRTKNPDKISAGLEHLAAFAGSEGGNGE